VERWGEGELQWLICVYPTDALAQEAGMTLQEYEDFVFSACMLDQPDPVASWRALSERQAAWAERLNRSDKLRIVAEGTDLSLSVKGRRWMNCDASQANLPDGEVFTCPVEDSAEGHVRFTYPATYMSRRVEDVRLQFEEGLLKDWSVYRGGDFFRSMTELDEGAKRLGEVAFGTNPHVQRFTGNTLFDEKIGGTMHLALGRGFPLAGGSNVSALHWDMVLDMHQGRVYADGELIYEGGEFR